MKRKLFVLFLIAFFIFGLDQFTKFLIKRFLFPYEVIPVIKGFFFITFIYNPHGAMGLYIGNRFVMLLFSFIALFIMCFYAYKNIENKFVFWASSLIIGGALGNITDRLFMGKVVDFLRFDFGSYTFPVFNVADMAVTIGIGLLLLETILLYFKEKTITSSDSPEEVISSEKDPL